MERNEKRTFQTVVAGISAVPLLAALAGIFIGPRFLGITQPTADLVSHLSYLSGLLLAIWIGFVSCLPDIEHKGSRFRFLTLMVVLGGLARLYALVSFGLPTVGHFLAIGLEVVGVPVLALWQMRIARKYGRAQIPNA